MKTDLILESQFIRTRPCHNCHLCGSEGGLLYRGLRDRVFKTPGDWDLKKCRNSQCGLIWLDPMPLEEDIEKAYINYYTHWRADVKSENQSAYKRFYNLIKKGYLALKYGYPGQAERMWAYLLGVLMYLSPRRRADLDFRVMYTPWVPNGHFLEVGCGRGSMLKIMHDLGWHVEGVDFDLVAVENARAKGLLVSLGSLEAQKYPDNCFDVVAMSHVIEHVPDPSRLLLECFRVIKPGGRMVIVTPNYESMGHRLFKDCWRGLEPPRHLHIFSASSLRNAVKNAGFEKVKVSTTIRDADGMLMASQSIRLNGRHTMGTSQSRSTRLWGRGMQMLEWYALKLNQNLGEEIALIAIKNG